MKVQGRTIGERQPCFVIAEMSSNHHHDYAVAEKIVRAAAAAGADAIKLQSYLPDSLTIDSDQPWFTVGGEGNPESWQKETFYHLYQQSYTPREWHAPLQKLAEGLGLVFFSTPYSPADVDFLERLGVPLYKIASYEATDIPFLERVAATRKPVIMSVGFATLAEIEYSVNTLRAAGCTELALLHCVSSYAEQPDAAHTNLRTMYDLAERFHLPVGFSDNNGGIEAPVLAAAMGAAIIEKHLVLDRNDTTFDARFSIDPAELKEMVRRIREEEQMKGAVCYGPQTPAEAYNRNFRRSLFVVKPMRKGEKFSAENVRSIRPANGLEAKYYKDILGKTAVEDIERGTPLRWDLIVKNE